MDAFWMSAWSGRAGGRRTIYTVARIAVLEDFTGGTDAVIEVRELGGAIDGVQMWVPGAPIFVPGQEVVLCLERAAGGVALAHRGDGVLRVPRRSAG